jgi:hypothetical protein
MYKERKMETAKDIADSLINRAKNMKTFTVTRILDDRDIIFKAGVIPFDLKVDKESLMTATVYAMSQQEADDSVDAWLRNIGEDD